MSNNKSIHQINRSLLDASPNRFHVDFYRFPENEGNILGRQIHEISRPDISYEIESRRYKSGSYKERGKHSFTTASATFRLDDNGLVLHALMCQYYRQNVLASDQKDDVYEPSGKEFDERFDVEITTYNAFYQKTGGFTLENALISSLDFQMSLGFREGDVEDTVMVQFEYEGFDFHFVYDTNIPII